MCLSLENRVYSEGRQQKMAIFSLFSWREVFVWLPTGFGKSMFPNASVSVLQAAHSAGIHKFVFFKDGLVLYSVYVSCYGLNNDHVHVKCCHNRNEYD